MSAIDMIHKSLMKNLPPINQQACEIFGVKHVDTEIMELEKLRNPLVYSLYAHKLLFCKEDAPRVWVNIGADFAKYFPEISLDDVSAVYLAHEVPHHIHDAASDYENGNEECNLFSLSTRENKYTTNYVAWTGICEGIVDCAKTNILNNLGMKKLLVAEKAGSEYLSKEESSSLSKFDMRRLLKEIESSSPKLAHDNKHISQVISLTGQMFREELERESLDNFRRFANEQRPSRMTYDGAKEVLKRTLCYAKTKI